MRSSWSMYASATCPLCGYNLRNLTRPQCPECHKDLTLAVDLLKPQFGWFLATVTPGLFSVIAAGFLLVPITFATLASNPPPMPIYVTDAFGWLSGIAALVHFRYRNAFPRQPQKRQILWAVIAWAVHVLVFTAFVLSAVLGVWK